MSVVFQVCFFVGLLLTVLLILGGIVPIPGIGDAEGADMDISLEGLGIHFSIPLNPTIYIVLLTVFGGVGMILESSTGLAGIFILLIALAAGILVSLLLYRFVIRPLKRAENTSAPDSEDLIGVLAVVTERIPENGFGQISYVVNGNTFSAPAKSTKGGRVAAGEEVSICWIQDHVFYVVPLKES